MKRNVKHTPALSFTTRYDKKVKLLVSDIHIGEPVTPGLGPPRPYKAIWDTGAGISLITAKVVDECGFKPIGIMHVQTAHGTAQSPVYLVNIYLPNKVSVTTRAATGKLSGNVDALIGMDVITLGDFAVTHSDGKTTLSFRIPSIEQIDFVQQGNLRGPGSKPKRRK